MHVWSKVFGPFPARSQETKRSAFEAVCNNSNRLHFVGRPKIGIIDGEYVRQRKFRNASRQVVAASRVLVSSPIGVVSCIGRVKLFMSMVLTSQVEESRR